MEHKRDMKVILLLPSSPMLMFLITRAGNAQMAERKLWAMPTTSAAATLIRLVVPVQRPDLAPIPTPNCHRQSSSRRAVLGPCTWNQLHRT